MNPSRKKDSDEIAELKLQLADARAASEAEIYTRQQTQQALLESEARFQAITDTYPVAVGISDVDGTFLYINKVYQQVFGYALEEINQINASDLYVDPEDRRKWLSLFQAKGSLEGYEVKLKHKDGTPFWALISVAPILFGGKPAIVGSVIDISAQKKAEQSLAALTLETETQRQRLSAIMESLPLGVAILDAQGGNIRGNRAFEQVWGSPRPAVDGVNGYTAYKAWWVDSGLPVQPEEWASAQAVQHGKTLTGQLMKIQRFDGKYAYVLNSAVPIFDQQGRVAGCAVAIQDVSALKQREDEVRQLNRTLKALSNSNQAMLHATSETGFLSQVCRIIVEDCGFAMVWIGYVQDDRHKSVKPVASAGFDQGYLDALGIALDDPVRGSGPTGMAIRTRQPFRCSNMLTDPCFAPWRQAAIERGYASSLVLPLISADRVFGAINIYSREPNGFSVEEEKLLLELAGDLSYGITALRLRAESARFTEALARSEEHYRSLFDNMTEGFALHEIVCDSLGHPSDYRFLEINPSFGHMTGLSHAQTIGRLASEVLPGLEPFWVETFGKVVQTGQPVQFDHYTATLGRYFRVYAYRPAPGQFAAIFMDITQSRQIELQLSAANEKYATLFNTTSDGIWINNLDGDILEVNDAYCLMSGYTRDELTRMSTSDIEASETPAEIAKHIQKVLEQSGHDRFETKHRRKDGSLMDVDITASYFDQALGRIAIFARDITERKRSEERLAYLASFPEQNPNPIVEVDQLGKVIYANRAALRMFPELLEAGLAHPWFGNWESVPQQLFKGQVNNLVRDIPVGERYFQQSLNYNASQGLVRIYGLDITQRKLADLALRRARDELEQRVQERTQELNIANNQLRTEVAERQKAQTKLESSLQELQVIEEELRNNNEMLLDAQKVLDNQRRRYQDLFEFAPDAYLVTDKNGQILEANQSATQLLAVSNHNLIGKPLMVFIAKADRTVFGHLLATVDNQPAMQSQEFRLKPRRGAEIIAAIRVAFAKDQENVATLRWNIRDITKRKQAEETIRQNALRNAVLSEVSQSLASSSLDEKAILDIVAEATARLVGDGCIITLLSDDGKVLQPVAWHHKEPKALPLMSSLSGTTYNLSIVGHSGSVFQASTSLLIKDLPPAEALESIPPSFREYVDSMGMTSVLIVPIKIGDKTIGTLGIIRNRDGQPYTESDQSLLETLSYRTGQSIYNARLYRELQAALRKELETHDQLVQTEKLAAVGRLLGSITHEINNPLQTIKNCLYLSQVDSPPGTPVYDALAIATTETNRLSNLVAQLREIYRPPTLGLSKLVSLPTVVNEVQVLLASYLQEKHIQWQVTPPQADLFSKLEVEGVPDQLKQVFLNICLNAIDAMESEGGSLMIDFKVNTQADQAGVCFHDTGPGLPAEVKAKLFEPFTTTKEKGLGLGLVICYDIIQKHNGHIEVESEPDNGAVFTVWLPIKRQ
jgi:PAS domain S-box-containing protein